jgi:hypothetical protein
MRYRITFWYVDLFDSINDGQREREYEAHTVEDAITEFRLDWGSEHRIISVAEAD